MRGWKRLNLVVLMLSLGVSGASFSYVNYGPIKSGDSLWHIASSHRAGMHVSTAKMVRAIEALNPSAKKLHVGSTLKVPSTISELQLALGEVSNESSSSGAATSELKSPQASSSLLLSQLSDQASFLKKIAPNHSVDTLASPIVSPSQSVAPAVSTTGAASLALAPRVTTQLVSPAVLASQLQAPSTSPSSELSQAQNNETSSSFWAWVWFAGLLVALAFGWKNRSRLFARLQGGKEIAARRLGLHRAEHEQVFDTDVLWTKEKPSYGDSHPFKEGDSMAQAMIQMAEGEYSEAKKTLTEAIARDPKNIDLRMKLLENCVALGDRESFKQESDDLLENLMDEADPRWGKIKNMYLRKWAYDAA